MEKLKKKIKNFGDFIRRYLVLRKERKINPKIYFYIHFYT